MNLSDVFQDAAENNGGTYQRSVLNDFWRKPNFTSGYMVSVYGMEMSFGPGDSFTVGHLARYVESYFDANSRRVYLGIWANDDTVYVDVSLHFEDEEEAEKFAIANAQIAYWDCKDGVAINV